MSIEAATPSNSSGTASQNQQTTSKVDVAHFTPGGASSATPSDYKELSDVLLGEEIGMMGSEVEHWNAKQAAAAPTLTRSTSHFLPPAHPQTQRQSPSPMHHQQQARAQPQSPAAAFFACPPAQLTRHASLPVSMIRPHVQPVHVHHPHAMPFAIAPHHPHMVAMPPPSLARNRSHGYIMHAAPPHPAYGMPRLVAFHHPMTPTMAPDFHHVRVHHPMNSINLSVSHQQPTVPVLHKPVDTKNSNDHVEPIAFNGANDARMSLGEIDSLALAVLSEPSKDKENKASKPDEEEEREGKETESTDDIMFKPSTASSIGCGQDLEKALDSLDKFLPDADQDLFRPSEFRMSEFRMSDLRPSDLAGLVVPPPPQPSVASTLITPRTTTMPTGRAALPLIMSPHIKTIPSPAGAMTMMMNMPHMHAHTPRTSPKPMATCKVGGCDRRVRSKGFCKTHGGGRKCSIEGCKKSSQNGEFCIGHGGGKKCKQEGCAKAAQSHGLCKAHGGGARCKYPNCNKSSQGGGLCRAHGGGKRCQAAGCPKGAQRGNFCATHGGFRNCKIDGCVRTDRGGGFCEVHRRGRLCKIDGCKKLARNQGMCTMHIREDKQDEIELSVASLNVA